MSSNPGGERPDPSMRPTSISVLVVAGLLAAAGGWLLLSFLYSSWPAPPWLPVIVLAVLAFAEGYLAQNTASRVQRRSGALPVEPLAVARYAVLAKASSLAGAIYAGYSAGLLAFFVLEPTKFARDAVPAAAGGVVASLLLVAAALWLERSCRVPDQPDQPDRNDEGEPGRRRA